MQEITIDSSIKAFIDSPITYNVDKRQWYEINLQIDKSDFNRVTQMLEAGELNLENYNSDKNVEIIVDSYVVECDRISIKPKRCLLV